MNLVSSKVCGLKTSTMFNDVIKDEDLAEIIKKSELAESIESSQ